MFKSADEETVGSFQAEVNAGRASMLQLKAIGEEEQALDESDTTALIQAQDLEEEVAEDDASPVVVTVTEPEPTPRMADPEPEEKHAQRAARTPPVKVGTTS